MDKSAPPSESAPSRPERSVDDAVDDGQLNQSLGDNRKNGESFVAAFRVTFEHDGSVSLVSPFADGEGLVRVLTTHVTAEHFRKLHKLPIRDLANPLIALVVKPSLERLVRAARAAAPYDMDLEAAVEPFLELVKE